MVNIERSSNSEVFECFRTRLLLQGESFDSFNQEIAVLVSTREGYVVFTGCGHKGLLNILHTARLFVSDAPIVAAIGGAHLIDAKVCQFFETPDEIRIIAETFQIDFPDTRLIAGHCTGRLVHQIFSDVLGGKFVWFYSGHEIEL